MRYPCVAGPALGVGASPLAGARGVQHAEKSDVHRVSSFGWGSGATPDDQ